MPERTPSPSELPSGDRAELYAELLCSVAEETVLAEAFDKAIAAKRTEHNKLLQEIEDLQDERAKARAALAEASRLLEELEPHLTDQDRERGRAIAAEIERIERPDQ